MTPNWVTPFLRALASGCTVSEAAAAGGISSSATYALRRSDGDFAEAWRIALEDSADVLEREARRRAIEGVEEPVVYQGQLTPVWERDAEGDVVTVQVPCAPYTVTRKKPDGSTEAVEITTETKQVQARNPDGSLKWLTVRKPSDALMALMLKGRRKEVFGTERTEISGPNGTPLQIDDVARRARIAAIVAAAKERSTLA